jgi:hypothetical protein
MNVEEIHINIDPTGKLSLALNGVKGESCLDLTKELEALLGNEIEERKFSYEYYEKNTGYNQNFLSANK